MPRRCLERACHDAKSLEPLLFYTVRRQSITNKKISTVIGTPRYVVPGSYGVTSNILSFMSEQKFSK